MNGLETASHVSHISSTSFLRGEPANPGSLITSVPGLGCEGLCTILSGARCLIRLVCRHRKAVGGVGLVLYGAGLYFSERSMGGSGSGMKIA